MVLKLLIFNALIDAKQYSIKKWYYKYYIFDWLLCLEGEKNYVEQFYRAKATTQSIKTSPYNKVVSLNRSPLVCTKLRFYSVFKKLMNPIKIFCSATWQRFSELSHHLLANSARSSDDIVSHKFQLLEDVPTIFVNFSRLHVFIS